MLQKYFGDKQFWKVLLRLALPIALQNLLISSLTLVDNLMVGQLGDIALSAVGMANQWSWLMNLLLFGVGSASALFISQYWGTKDIPSIRRTFGIAMISALGMTLIFAIPAIFIPETIMMIFNRTPEVVTEGAAYLRAVSTSYLATAFTSIMAIVLRSTEKVKLPMWISVMTTGINVFFNYCLIFGKLGFPQLGVTGAAIATSISAWTGLILIIIISLIQKNILIAPIKEIFSFTKTQLVEFYKKASPVILNEGMWALGTVLCNAIFSNLGHEYYAAVTILRTFENIAFTFFVGLCNASSVMIGKSIGKGLPDRAIGDSIRFTIIIPMMGLFVGAICAIFRYDLVSVFNISGNVNEVTVTTAATLILTYGLWVPFRNIPYIQIVGIFRPGGDTVVGVKLDLACLWLCALPVTFIAAYVLDLPFTLVFFIMYIFEDIPKSILCLIHYLKLKWIKPVTKEGIEGFERFKAEKQKLLNSKKGG